MATGVHLASQAAGTVAGAGLSLASTAMTEGTRAVGGDVAAAAVAGVCGAGCALAATAASTTGTVASAAAGAVTSVVVTAVGSAALHGVRAASAGVEGGQGGHGDVWRCGGGVRCGVRWMMGMCVCLVRVGVWGGQEWWRGMSWCALWV